MHDYFEHETSALLIPCLKERKGGSMKDFLRQSKVLKYTYACVECRQSETLKAKLKWVNE